MLPPCPAQSIVASNSLQTRSYDMIHVVEFSIYGIFLGVAYGLIACPLSLVFTTSGILDVAMGSYAVLAAAIAYSTNSLGPVSIILGIVASMAAATILGIYCSLLERQFPKDKLVVIFATFAFSFVLGSLVLTYYGTTSFHRDLFTNTLVVSNIRMPLQYLVNLSLGVAMALVIYLLLNRTSFGIQMRACSDNEQGALLNGIFVRRIKLTTFLLGGFLAGVAGILMLYTIGLTFDSGLSLTIMAIGSALLFGLTRPLLAFGGGIIIGIIESLSYGFGTGAMGAIIPLIFILLTLAFLNRRNTVAFEGRA